MEMRRIGLFLFIEIVEIDLTLVGNASGEAVGSTVFGDCGGRHFPSMWVNRNEREAGVDLRGGRQGCKDLTKSQL